MSDLLETEANNFATDLTRLIQACINDAPKFTVISTSHIRSVGSSRH